MSKQSRIKQWALRGFITVGATAGSLYLGLKHVAGDGGLVTVHDHQVAGFLNHVTQELEPIERAGMRSFMPWFQGVYTMDRRPVEYVMEGSERIDANHVPGLVVRGADGTCFSFERVEIQYALQPSKISEALLEFGPGEGFKDGLVDAYARGILRNAFGRLTASSVVLPDKKQQATLEAKSQLSEKLSPFGLEILELSCSKPKFSPKYEEIINRRKVADQDVQRINAERAQLLAAGPAALEQLRNQKQLELERARETLRAKIAEAERQQQRTRHEADLRFENRVQDAQSLKAAAAGKTEGVLRTVQVENDRILAEAQRTADSTAAVLAQLQQTADLERAELQTSHGAEIASLTLQLNSQRQGAEQYATQRLHTAGLELASALNYAAVDRELAVVRAKGFKAQTEAMADQGIEAVRAALVEKLAGIRIELTTVQPIDPGQASKPALR